MEIFENNVFHRSLDNRGYASTDVFYHQKEKSKQRYPSITLMQRHVHNKIEKKKLTFIDSCATKQHKGHVFDNMYLIRKRRFSSRPLSCFILKK